MASAIDYGKIGDPTAKHEPDVSTFYFKQEFWNEL